MSSLQKVNLGTPPKAEDGDAVRVANVKANANVDVLNAQSALTSAAQLVDSAQALTAALHLGRRVNISLAVAGIVQVPAAATCGADGVMLLRNIGATVVTLAITTGSGDTLSLSKLNPGETVLLDTDGVHAWTVLMRGRTNSDNEVVNGNFKVSGNSTINGDSTVNNSTVNGNETIGGNLSVAGSTKVSGDTTLSYVAGNQRGVNWAVGTSLRWRLVSDGAAETGANAGSNLILARYTDAGVYVDNPLIVNRATGALAFGQRPAFNGNTPWDTGNLNPSLYALLSGAVFAGAVSVAGSPWAASMLSARNSSANIWGVSSYSVYQSGGGCFIGRVDATATPFAGWFFGTSGVGSITTNGASTFYNTTSDYRLKTKSRAIKDPIATLQRIRFYEGEFKAQPGVRVHYVIAHELQEVVDYAVVGEKDAVTADGTIKPQFVDYSKLVPLLGAALQNALERIAALESK